MFTLTYLHEHFRQEAHQLCVALGGFNSPLYVLCVLVGTS